MSYEEALTMAGAAVLKFKEFGSYQGTWWALVNYGGRLGFVAGAYGSCSGCDAFEAEFGWQDSKLPDYPERMKQFGSTYLDDILTFEEAVAEAGKYDWDMTSDEMVAWVRQQWEWMNR